MEGGRVDNFGWNWIIVAGIGSGQLGGETPQTLRQRSLAQGTAQEAQLLIHHSWHECQFLIHAPLIY